jgi:hypothetical protein
VEGEWKHANESAHLSILVARCAHCFFSHNSMLPKCATLNYTQWWAFLSGAFSSGSHLFQIMLKLSLRILLLSFVSPRAWDRWTHEQWKKITELQASRAVAWGVERPRPAAGLTWAARHNRTSTQNYVNNNLEVKQPSPIPDPWSSRLVVCLATNGTFTERGRIIWNFRGKV